MNARSLPALARAPRAPRLAASEALTVAWWLDRWPLAAAVLIAALVGLVEVALRSGSGDYGQWLMLSRYYSGQSIPEYRNPLAVPPALPALLSAFRLLIPGDILAIQIFKGTLAGAFVLSTYAAGASLFRDRRAGLLAVVFGFLVTDRLLEPFAFGGLPQLLALVGINLAVASFAEASRGARTPVWWTLGALALAFTASAHLGTATIAIAAISGVAAVSALRAPLGWRERLQAMLPLAIALAVIAGYYVQVLLPLNDSYADNAASLNYRGPDRIPGLLESYAPTLVALGVGVPALVAGLAFELRHRRPAGFTAVAVWTAAPVGALALAMGTSASTDYPRFVPVIVAPLMVAAGGGAALTLRAAWEAFRMPSAAAALASWQRVGVIAVVAVLASASLSVLRTHAAETSGYRVDSTADLRAAAQWLDDQMAPGAAVLADAREGKWIEGFSGRPGLFSIPTRYSFREIEHERSVDAETLLRSTATIASPAFLVKFAERAGDVPGSPWLAVDHHGEYLDFIRLPASRTAVIVREPDGTERRIAVSELKPITSWRELADGSVSISTNWRGDVAAGTISFTRTIWVGTGNQLQVTDHVVGTAPILRIVTEVRSTDPTSRVESAVTSSRQGTLELPQRGRASPLLGISTPGTIAAIDDGLNISSPGRVMSFVITARSWAEAEPQAPRVLLPAEIVERQSVGAALLREGPATEARIERLRAVDFEVSRAFGPYIVMLHRPGVGVGAE